MNDFLQQPYNRDELVSFLQGLFLPDDYSSKQEVIDIPFKPRHITSATLLGTSPSIKLRVYEICHESEHDPRVGLSKDTFRLMSHYGCDRALVFFTSPKSTNYRFSLVTITFALHPDGKRVGKEYSNPRRYSWFLGPDAKVHTPAQYLFKNGQVATFEDLRNRFSIEVVNKEFYARIAELFTELTGGLRMTGTKEHKFTSLLHLPSTNDDKIKKEFTMRLIGRLVFCWFLRKKKSDKGVPLVPEELLSTQAIAAARDDYYHAILEPLFFEVLNTPIKERVKEYQEKPWSIIPFLNGGLFSPDDHDYYISKNANYDLKVPDSWTKDLFELFETYNFTIDENTSIDIELSVDPEMLGRIFENLLAEINPETGETARKSTGSFYTPRAIVEFMVDQSLSKYIAGKTGTDESVIKSLLNYAEDVCALSDSEKNDVLSALTNIKILDPACGSGAFPMGIMQKISLILHKIDPDSHLWRKRILGKIESKRDRDMRQKKLERENVQYTHKHGIIQDSIYGVDIQESAVEISKLRFFLSLIVDENICDSKENRGIMPLPNLEFKFVCANTLVSLPPRQFYDNELFEDRDSINKLRELRDEYFTANGTEKKKLEIAFKDIQNRMFDSYTPQFIKEHQHRYSSGSSIRSENNISNVCTQTMILSSWEPFTGKPSAWFDPDWMFGISDGFDIVIGNPPYVQIQKFSGLHQQKQWESQNYQTFTKTGDIYCLFYERGWRLLKDGGLLVYITSNKWMRANYGKLTRKWLASTTNPLILIDFENYCVFETATVNTNILVIEKGINAHVLKAVTIGNDFKESTDIGEYLEGNGVRLKDIGEDSWLIASHEEFAVKKRIEKAGIALKDKDWGLSICRGIISGLNEAYIIDEKKKNELITMDPKSAEILKPILRGRDIKRYKIQEPVLWVILATFGTHKIMKNKYPAIYNHLRRFQKALEQRGQCRYSSSGRVNADRSYPGQHHWLELDNNPREDYIKEFEKTKITWGNLCISSQFSLCDPGVTVSAPSPIITPGNKYLLAVLNSKVGDYYIRSLGVTRSGGYFEYKPMFVENLPVPKIAAENQVPYEILVDCMMFCKRHGLESESTLFDSIIDGLVYDLYFCDEMKQANCYITDCVADILRPFNKYNADSLNAEQIKSIEMTLLINKPITHALTHRHLVKPVKTILDKTNESI